MKASMTEAEFAVNFDGLNDELGLTAQKLVNALDAQGLSVSPSTISNWRNRKNAPPTDEKRLAVIEAMRNIASKPTERAEQAIEEAERDDEVLVPVFGTASAGNGLVPLTNYIEVWERMSVPQFVQRFRRMPPASGKSRVLGLFRVEGSSAAPVYFDGETVAVEIYDPPTQRFTNDLVYVFRWDDQVMLKQLRMVEGGTVQANSLNPAIEPFSFNPSGEHEFAVLARVIENEKQQLYGSLVGRFLRMDTAA